VLESRGDVLYPPRGFTAQRHVFLDTHLQRAIRVYETHEEINATIHPPSPNDESVFHNIDPFAAELSDQTVVTYPIHGIPQDAKIIKVVLGGIVGNTTSMRLTNRPRPGFFPDNALACTTPDSVARHVNAAFRQMPPGILAGDISEKHVDQVCSTPTTPVEWKVTVHIHATHLHKLPLLTIKHLCNFAVLAKSRNLETGVPTLTPLVNTNHLIPCKILVNIEDSESLYPKGTISRANTITRLTSLGRSTRNPAWQIIDVCQQTRIPTHTPSGSVLSEQPTAPTATTLVPIPHYPPGRTTNPAHPPAPGASPDPLAEGGDEHMTEAQGTDVTDPPTPFSNPDAPGHDHAPPTKKAKGQKTNAADDAEVAGPPRKLTSPSPPLSFSVPVTYPPPDHLDFHDIEEVRRASEAYMHSDWRNIEAEDKPNWLVKLEVILQLALINKEDHDDTMTVHNSLNFMLVETTRDKRTVTSAMCATPAIKESIESLLPLHIRRTDHYSLFISPSNIPSDAYQCSVILKTDQIVNLEDRLGLHQVIMESNRHYLATLRRMFPKELEGLDEDLHSPDLWDIISREKICSDYVTTAAHINNSLVTREGIPLYLHDPITRSTQANRGIHLMLLNRATVLITFLSTRGILHSGGSTYTLRPSFLPDYDPAMTKGKPGKIWNCLATWMIRREISKNSAKGKVPLDPHTKGDLDQWKALKTSLDGHPPEYHVTTYQKAIVDMLLNHETPDPPAAWPPAPYEAADDDDIFGAGAITSEHCNTPADPELGNDWSSFLQTAALKVNPNQTKPYSTFYTCIPATKNQQHQNTHHSTGCQHHSQQGLPQSQHLQGTQEVANPLDLCITALLLLLFSLISTTHCPSGNIHSKSNKNRKNRHGYEPLWTLSPYNVNPCQTKGTACHSCAEITTCNRLNLACTLPSPISPALTLPIDSSDTQEDAHSSKYPYSCPLSTPPTPPTLRGGRPRGSRRLQSKSESAPYWEAQTASHCQIHSINAYLGYKAMDINLVLDFANKLHTQVTRATDNHWKVMGSYFLNPSGNYNNALIDYYTFTKQTGTGYLVSHRNHPYTPLHTSSPNTEENYETGIQLGSTKQQILSRIPINSTKFILHYWSNGYGHAITIKYYNNKWYNLDSEISGPTILTPQDWHQLQGRIYTLSQATPSFHGHPFQPDLYFDPTNPHPNTNGTILEDSQQINTYTNPPPSPPDQTIPTTQNNTETPTDEDDDIIYLVSEDESHAKRKKPYTSTKKSKKSKKTTTTKKRSRSDLPPPIQAARLPTPSRPTIPEYNKLRQTRIPGAPPPSKKQQSISTTKPTSPVKRSKPKYSEQTSDHPVQQQEHILNDTNITTINCRGIGSSWEVIYDHIRSRDNDIIILTETKLLSHRKSILNMIKSDMHDYHFHHNSKTTLQATSPDKIVTPSAGVITLIRKTVTAHPVNHETPVELSGHITHQTINNITHVLGVYMPCNNAPKRENIYSYIHHITEKNPTHHYILAGDWNATCHTTDRSSLTKYPDDNSHQQHISQLCITPKPQPRPHTYFSCSNNTPYSSRIDDILLINSPPGTHTTESTHQMGDTLDHHALEQRLTSTLLPPPTIPPTNTYTSPQLLLPLKQSDKEKTRQAITTQYLHQFLSSHTNIESAWQTAQDLLGEDRTASHIQSIRQELMTTLPEDLNSMADHLMTTLHQALSIMIETCPTKQTISGIFLPRKTAKSYQQLNQHVKHIKTLRTQSYSMDQSGYDNLRSSPSFPPDCPLQTTTQVQLLLLHNPLLTQYRQSLTDDIQHTIQELRTIQALQKEERSTKAIKKFRHRLNTQARVTHRHIFKPDGQPHSPTVLLNQQTGTLHTKTKDLLDLLTKHMGKLMSPPVPPPNGNYTAYSTPPPWETHTDKFQLETPATSIQHTASPYTYLSSPTAYTDCIRKLATNKATGPDGIPNELLMCLPTEMHTVIHKLMQISWILGETPDCWKTSHTVMLYKKSDPYLPQNYRPIGLNNSVAKLWTSLITNTISTYSETNHILSTCQEGFRKDKSTYRQLLNLLHNIEDASLFQQDLYAAYFDFSSAFNMIDHQKLLCIMHNLGFTHDTIDTVKGIYTNSNTHILLNNTPGQPIPITRGSIQGDTLSPLLFIIFIEPLHRWLCSGGRGYRAASLPTAEADEHLTSSLGYADDTAVLTGTVEDLRIQCGKVQLFSTWSGIPLNATKCVVSGILHKTHPSNPTHTDILKQRLQDKIALGDTYATYQPPDIAYKYLGVHISLTLNWKTQLHATLDIIHTKGLHILNKAKSRATPEQCIRIITQCIRAAIKYPMIVAPFSLTDIHIIDKAVLKTVKLCSSLPMSFPTRALHLPKTEAGLGIPSLLTEYTQITASALTHAMNDTGRLGILTKSLLTKTFKTFHTLTPTSLSPKLLQYSSLARQLQLLDHSNIQITWNDTELLDKLNIQSVLPQPAHIPVSLVTPFHDLGIYTYHDLVTPAGTHLITTTDLPLITQGKVTKHHRRSLNLLTAHLTGNSPDLLPSFSHANPLPLPQQQLTSSYTIPPKPSADAQNMFVARPASTPTQRYPTSRAQPPVKEADYTADPLRDLSGEQWWAWTTCNSTAEWNANVDHYGKAWGNNEAATTWASRLHLCKAIIRGPAKPFFKHYNITKVSNPDLLKAAMLHPTPGSPSPPTRLLHLTYGNQYKPLSITSWRSKRTMDTRDTSITTTAHLQWAPITMHNDHISQYTQIGYTILHSNPITPTTSEVHWKPQPYHTTHLITMLGQSTYDTLLQAFKDTPTTTTHLNPRRDSHLTNSQQQGQWATTPGFNADNHALVHKLLHIDTHDRNPTWDIQSPLKHTAQTGILTGSEGHQTHTHADTTFLYNPTGKCVGHSTNTLLTSLHTHYEYNKTTRPSTWNQLTQGGFLPDLAALYTRHKDTPASTYTLPPALHQANLHLNITHHRTATPLNLDSAYEEFSSMNPADQLFGANGDLFHSIWTGGSLVDIPTSVTDAHKALRWALASADHAEAQHIPTCTVLLIPDNYNAPYKKLLHHPWIHHVDSRPFSEIYSTSETWLGGKHHNPTSSHKLHILIISNPSSKPEYLNRLQGFKDIWSQHMLSISPYWEPHNLPAHPTLTSSDTQITYPRTLKSLTTLPWQPTTHHCPPLLPTVIYPCHYPAIPTLGLQVYTDGSLIKGAPGTPSKIGAGVYIPVAGMSYSINPGGQGATRTNNRAELVAIHQAIARIDYNTDLTLHTDSLCSLQLINKMIQDPTTSTRSLHSELLHSIRTHLVQRILAGSHTTLCKVRSHTGILGNDRADALARNAATNPASVRYTDTTGEQPRHNTYWPTVQPPCTPLGTTPPRALAPNLTNGISLNLPTSCHLGQHPLKGIYATTWADNTLLHLPHSSNKFWTSSHITHKTKFCILKARWGRLWNKKLAYRWKMPYANNPNPATSPTCPICTTHEDGAGHILAGCTHATFKGMYIKRHDAAVHLLHKAISKGALGSRRVIMDAGRLEDLPRGVLGKTLPDWLRPPSISAEIWPKLRPDLAILPEVDSPTIAADKEIWILELGYCSDTNHATKAEDKHAQHTQLVAGLRLAGYLVHYLVVTIGTTGTIPRTFVTSMTTLGLTNLEILPLADQLHHHSVDSFQTILQCRRFMEHHPAGD